MNLNVSISFDDGTPPSAEASSALMIVAGLQLVAMSLRSCGLSLRNAKLRLPGVIEQDWLDPPFEIVGV